MKAQNKIIEELGKIQWNGDHMWSFKCNCHACKKNTEIEELKDKIIKEHR